MQTINSNMQNTACKFVIYNWSLNGIKRLREGFNIHLLTRLLNLITTETTDVNTAFDDVIPLLSFTENWVKVLHPTLHKNAIS